MVSSRNDERAVDELAAALAQTAAD
jgi:hypothetical protein